MDIKEKKQHIKRSFQTSILFKFGATCLLLLFSIIIVACETVNNNNASDLGAPQVTVTIRFNNSSSPTPTAAPFSCGAWVTHSTVPFSPGSQVAVNAKFVQNDNGNPKGVAGATAQASMQWADGSRPAPQTRVTQADGVAVFFFDIPNNPALTDKINLVVVTFNGAGTTCSTNEDRAAYFTLTKGTPSATATQQNK